MQAFGTGSSARIVTAATTTVIVILAVAGAYAQQGCDADCGDSVNAWTTFTGSPGQPVDCFRLTNNEETCVRLWRTKTDMGLADNGTTTRKKYRKVTTTCTLECFANGGVFGKASCPNPTFTGEDLEIECWNECSNPPPPP